jgi:pyruvate kinase
MVAHGDLGVELPVEEVPLLQVRLKNNIYNFGEQENAHPFYTPLSC